MPLVLRAVKGSDLTPNEADGNFTFLDGRITTIEGLPLGVGIANITASGTTMTITMTDSSVYTVQLPMADFTTLWAGAWLPSHAYTAGQMVTAYPPMGLYGVLQDHTSDTTFDAGAGDTAGDFYALLLTIPAVATYFVSSSTFTPGLIYANSYIRCTNASGCVVTIDQDSNVNFPISTELHFRDCSTDTGAFLTFDSPTGVTLNPDYASTLLTPGSGATVGLKKIAANEWDAFGRWAPE